MNPATLRQYFWHLGLALLLLLAVASAAGAASPWREPQRLGLSLYQGMSYDPGNEIRFHLLSASALYDYAAVSGRPAPAALRLKVTGSLGVARFAGENRGVAAAGIMALYYLDRWGGESWRPYGEAGIGLIYTDFQVHDQGLRVNFNPRFGVGCEFGGPTRPWFAALHGHHLSNGHLYRHNRGINSVFFELGRYF